MFSNQYNTSYKYASGNEVEVRRIRPWVLLPVKEVKQTSKLVNILFAQSVMHLFGNTGKLYFAINKVEEW